MSYLLQAITTPYVSESHVWNSSSTAENDIM